MNKLSIKRSALERMKTLQFGDEITDVSAGEGNPRRHAYFCKHVEDITKNLFATDFGISHQVMCTDKKGNFWNTGVEVIFKGHLDYEKCKELVNPIWEAYYS